jgi:hypothetical protein
LLASLTVPALFYNPTSDTKQTKVKRTYEVPMILFVTLSLFLSLNTHAQDAIEDIEIIDVEEESIHYRVRDVRNYVRTIDRDTTCMDEYLKRRRNISLQLALTPATLVAGTATTAIGGAVAGSISYTVLYKLLGVLKDANGGWAQLGYIIIGGTVGAAAGGVYVLADSGFRIKEMVDHQRIMKALMEANHGEIGSMTEKLHAEMFKKYPESIVTIEEFSQHLLSFDESGELCDGSLRLKKPRFFKKSLKAKLASSKDIFYQLNQ